MYPFFPSEKIPEYTFNDRVLMQRHFPGPSLHLDDHFHFHPLARLKCYPYLISCLMQRHFPGPPLHLDDNDSRG